MDFTDTAFRQMMEIIDLVILSIPCLIAGIFIFKGIYRTVENPAKRSKGVSICITAAATVVLVLILYFVVLLWAVSIRGRWCEGCMEYH